MRVRAVALALVALVVCQLSASGAEGVPLSARRAANGHTPEAEADRVNELPGVEQDDFGRESLFGGYVTVDEDAGRALYYLLAEAQSDADTAPLVVWLNGGPGCSSIGGGFIAELGPFYPKVGGHGLQSNPHSWTRLANIVFIDSPAFVGYSYSNTTADATVGDERTASDLLTFMHGFMDRFPRFKARPMWISGESYGGHYVPQLTNAIYEDPAFRSGAFNLRGMFLGNPWTDAVADNLGQALYLVNEFLASEESMDEVVAYCTISSVWPLKEGSENGEFEDEVDAKDHIHGSLRQAVAQYRRGQELDTTALFALPGDELASVHGQHETTGKPHSDEDPSLGPTADQDCKQAMEKVLKELGAVSLYNIYQDVCLPTNSVATAMARVPGMLQSLTRAASLRVSGHDQAHSSGEEGIRSEHAMEEHQPAINPCLSKDLTTYLRLPAVQRALHANMTGLHHPWTECSSKLKYSSRDAAKSMVPLYRKLQGTGLKLVVYSGTTDAAVPATGTQLWLSRMHLHVERPWRQWNMPSGQQGGHVIDYEGGLTFVTVRGAGHMVPYTQPKRALHLFERVINEEKL